MIQLYVNSILIFISLDLTSVVHSFCNAGTQYNPSKYVEQYFSTPHKLDLQSKNLQRICHSYLVLKSPTSLQIPIYQFIHQPKRQDKQLGRLGANQSNQDSNLVWWIYIQAVHNVSSRLLSLVRVYLQLHKVWIWLIYKLYITYQVQHIFWAPSLIYVKYKKNMFSDL